MPEGQEYTYLILDDGEDGFIQLDGKKVIHCTFRHATSWSDDQKSLDQIDRVRLVVPGAKIYRVRATFEEV